MNGLQGLPSGPLKIPAWRFISDVLRQFRRETVSLIPPPPMHTLPLTTALALPNSRLTESKKLKSFSRRSSSSLLFILTVFLQELLMFSSS